MFLLLQGVPTRASTPDQGQEGGGESTSLGKSLLTIGDQSCFLN